MCIRDSNKAGVSKVDIQLEVKGAVIPHWTPPANNYQSPSSSATACDGGSGSGHTYSTSVSGQSYTSIGPHISFISERSTEPSTETFKQVFSWSGMVDGVNPSELVSQHESLNPESENDKQFNIGSTSDSLSFTSTGAELYETDTSYEPSVTSKNDGQDIPVGSKSDTPSSTLTTNRQDWQGSPESQTSYESAPTPETKPTTTSESENTTDIFLYTVEVSKNITTDSLSNEDSSISQSDWLITGVTESTRNVSEEMVGRKRRNIDEEEMVTNRISGITCDLSNAFHCSSGECIQIWMTCNMFPDCKDGSDELDCGSVLDDCHPGEVRCVSGEMECIPAVKECDGVEDCLTGEDESRIYCQEITDFSKLENFQDDRYGNCYIFNHGRDSHVVANSTRTGAKYGLKLTLFIEQKEYISIYGREAGVKVVVDTQDRVKFPQDEGIIIRPGAITFVSLRYNVVSKLGEPHGKCNSDSENFLKNLQKAYGITGDNFKYDTAGCEKSCVIIKIKEECGCTDTVTKDANERCDVLNKTQDVCTQLMYYLYNQQLLNCNCLQQCHKGYYSQTVSQSTWPSDVYLSQLLRSIHSINDKTRYINDETALSKDVARLEVFFEELNYQSTTEEPAYLIENLISDIGGTAGLYIGISIISFCEFIELVFQCLKYTKAWMTRSKK
ncbi:very low-density lipoprotein receptor-like [Anneissia japonica]|uniref:very low-density lipoprotein receptor-like n=1 Tax=Anneissia japonica TaxID=1529436 RepID=UPI0014259CA5|nr:very low-density lipoprotein receptor-like [Anneissia japonica]